MIPDNEPDSASPPDTGRPGLPAPETRPDSVGTTHLRLSREVREELTQIVHDAVARLVEFEPERPESIEALITELRAQRQTIDDLMRDLQAKTEDIRRLQGEAEGLRAKKDQMKAERDRALQMVQDARPGALRENWWKRFWQH